MRFFNDEDHARTMTHGPDVPGQQPAFPLPLDEVGIAAKNVWVRLPEGRLAFTARLTVSLVGNRRGIHMSRMEDAVSALADREFISIAGYVECLVRLLLEGQDSATATAALEGLVPLASRTAVSGRFSSDAFQLACRIMADRAQPGVRMALRVGIWHLTVCPCTQVYAQTALAAVNPACPLPSHSQRSFTSLEVEDTGLSLHQEQLLAILSRSLHPCQDLLKRPDEAELVMAAHSRPQFAEDAVRAVAGATAAAFPHLPPAAVVRIESRSWESIHIHDVICRLTSTLGELRVSAGRSTGR